MSSTLYVDGLPASVEEQELKSVFSTFGNVLSVDIHQPERAFSSGIGIVEMASLEDAAKAIFTLHRSYWGGEFLLVFHALRATKTLQRVETPVSPFGRDGGISSLVVKDVLHHEGSTDAAAAQPGFCFGIESESSPPGEDPWDRRPPVVLCG